MFFFIYIYFIINTFNFNSVTFKNLICNYSTVTFILTRVTFSFLFKQMKSKNEKLTLVIINVTVESLFIKFIEETILKIKV